MVGRDSIMNKTIRTGLSRSVPFLGLLAAVWALSGPLSLSGCKAVDLGGPAVDTANAASDSAVIQVTNNISEDPDSITLLLFPSSTVEVTNASLSKRLGTVAYGGTRSVKVPTGTWKLAYQDKAGNRFAMRDEQSGGLEWLKAIFEKNGSYALILSSDGNLTIWDPTFTTNPPIHP
jgi:hypothetical protein